MRFLVYAGLVCYGLFYHISSSEFWPVTISKTWFSPDFEISLLQKPFFSLFLALFHVLPLDDVLHLVAVKLAFAIIGLAGLVCFVKAVVEISGQKISARYELLLLVLLVATSPTLLNNFFRIRTDQLSFLFFSLALLYSNRKQYLKALSFWIMLPLIGIKALVFFLPAGILFYPEIKTCSKQLPKSKQIHLLLACIAVLVWALGLNIPAISYLGETFRSMEFPNAHLRKFLTSEALLVLGTLFVSGLVLFRKEKEFRRITLASLACFALILLLPQSYPYFIASLAPIFYLPLFLKLLKPGVLKKYLLFAPAAQIVLVFSMIGINEGRFYHSNAAEFDYIGRVTKIIDKHNLTYVDGTGILPKQKLIPCFISPDDEAANYACSNFLANKIPDVVIATSRLNYLGIDLYKAIESEYSQIIPGLWLKNKYKSLVSENNTDLSASLPAVFLFGFD